MDYLVRFVGHIVERDRPESFPKMIWQDILVPVNPKPEEDGQQILHNAINSFMSFVIRQRGMVVQKDSRFDNLPKHELESTLKGHDQNIFVPFYRIAYIETVTRILSPDSVKEGNSEEDTLPEVRLQ